jgi:hypothetical protein
VLTGGTVNLVGKIASGHVTSGRVKATFNV